MSKYEVRYVGDWISYIYDNETKEAVRISNEDFVRLLNKQDKQISDLETKLADTEFRYENLHNLYYKDTEELKQQLAEKDEEIETYKKQFNEQAGLCEEFRFQLAEKESELAIFKKRDIDNQKQLERQMNIHKHYLIKKDQDKILFAVEQLEKVKELINNKLEFMWQNNAEMTCRDRHIIEKCYEDIDELITEIKERNQDE